jgi:hypothetical protein
VNSENKKRGIIPESEAHNVKLGPDGEFYRGKPLRKSDRGGLHARFSRLPGERILVMEFATTLEWIGAPPEHAIQQAQAFRAMVHKNFGKMGTDPRTFPMKVVANKDTNIVETFFPEPVGILAANPEVFLVWADKLEEAAKQLTPAA